MTYLPSNRERYDRIARFYDVLDGPFEDRRYRAIRPLLFQGLTGKLLDAGIGTGRNIPFYPSGAEMVGIDISPAMLRRAAKRRVSLGAEVDLRWMDVTHLDFQDDSFDGAVATFLFCVLPDSEQVLALRELGRVVKPDGIVRLLEYVRPHGRVRRLMGRVWEPWMAWAYGASFDRRTEEHVTEARLRVLESRFVVDDLVKLISLKPMAGPRLVARS